MAAVYVNQEEGLKRVRNNKKLYITLLTKFKNETNLTELLSCIAEKNYEKAEASAHTLKGLSGNLSLTALCEKATELDAQLKNQTIDADAVAGITACFNETQKAIDEVLAANG
ncbi:MAG: Hpt domain-containing protein [Treponema sp.]|jgi:HPt (histidine-containing phosphotransfer) domain-containing protein|nr:Hpt domain-containing protein [Treponema sp.]